MDDDLRRACVMVERFARSIGRDCEIVFHKNGVQVAPLSWAGDVQGVDLYEALLEARKSSDE